MNFRSFVGGLLCLLPIAATAQQSLIDQGYFAGRNYYVLRSGRAKMILQADRVSLGPSFMFLVFDAEKTDQTKRKNRAYNYTASEGFSSSALEVVLNGFPCTALGTQLETCWVNEQGIPGVEANWWASGARVRETITPLGEGIFRRRITLSSGDLAGADTLTFRLGLHAPATLRRGHVIVWNDEEVSMALTLPETICAPEAPAKNQLASTPIPLAPGDTQTFDTYLIVDIPGSSPEELYRKASTLDQQVANLETQAVRSRQHANRITTADSLVQHLYDVNRYILPGYVSEQGRMDAGIFEYGGQWVRDASHTTLGMIHIGEFEAARAMLSHMLRNMINDQGTTMIYGSFQHPDLEQLDQMGEFMYTLKSYYDWTGDASLLTEYKDKLKAMINRPLHPTFRDSTGMVHNRREFWERVFDDAYELVYQHWVIVGLRSAAALAPLLDAEAQADTWLEAAAQMEHSMLHHPTLSLVEDGKLIKRRNRTGEAARIVAFNCRVAPGAPVAIEKVHNLTPDSGVALAIATETVDPQSELARNTLDELETLWNRRWSFGGYERYNSSAQIDQPGPWTFATCFIMRAQHEAGLLDRSRRSLEWLYEHGGHSGAWHEQIPILKYQESLAGILPWTSAEVAYFLVHHMLGVKFEAGHLVLAPRLYPGSGPLTADLRYKTGRFTLEIDGDGPVSYALIDGIRVKPDSQGRIAVPSDFTSGTIRIVTR